MEYIPLGIKAAYAGSTDNAKTQEVKFKLNSKTYESTLGMLKVTIGDELANTTRFGLRCHDLVVNRIKTRVSKKHKSDKREMIVNGYALYWVYGKIPKGPYKYIFSTYKAIKYQGIADAKKWLHTYVHSLSVSSYGGVLAGKSIKVLVKFANIRCHEYMLKYAIEIIQAGGNIDFIKYCIQNNYQNRFKGLRTNHIISLLDKDMQKRPYIYRNW